MITILGARGTIKNVESFVEQLLVFSTQEHLVIQAFDASVIYGKDHLISATIHAKRAFQQGTNATNNLALEILLYAAGERQIQKAIKKIGVKKGQKQIIFLITDLTDHTHHIGVDTSVIDRLLTMFHLTKDEQIPTGNKETMKHFGITEKELSTVTEERYGDLILEKVALVDIIK
jgi:KEOPS complex subunit Cgi121